MTDTEIMDLLHSHNIPLEKWGTGEAKTVQHLLQEIDSKEIELRVDGDTLLRHSIGAALYVYCTVGEKTYFLKEAKQVFHDGRTKVRNIETSVGEKLVIGEDPTVGAYRALREELGVTEPLELVPCDPIIRNRVPSISFPGLKTYYYVHTFKVSLPERFYRPEGYTERQADKTNYFVWKEL